MQYGPNELTQIGADPAAFRKYGHNEYHGPCPECGGDDRFVIFTDRPFPAWNYFCRVCTPEGGWVDQLNENLKEISPAERARRAGEYAKQREEALRVEIEKAQSALEELQQARAWLQYHDQLDKFARDKWESWGIPPYFQEYWKLGYKPEHTIWANGEEWTTRTMTIPIFEQGTWNVLNIRHRLLDPPRPGDKYRPERSGLPAPLFIADPDLPIAGRTLLVEGEKKAMVSYIAADDPNLQVLGVPGKTPPKDMLAKFEDCDPIYVCLDPDAYTTNKPDGQTDIDRMVDILGSERVRVMRLPMKIDDAVLAGALDKEGIKRLMRVAR